MLFSLGLVLELLGVFRELPDLVSPELLRSCFDPLELPRLVERVRLLVFERVLCLCWLGKLWAVGVGWHEL